MPVMTCSCDNPGQNKLHGKGQRVFNEVKTNNGIEYRCTVCGAKKGDVGKKK